MLLCVCVCTVFFWMHRKLIQVKSYFSYNKNRATNIGSSILCIFDSCVRVRFFTMCIIWAKSRPKIQLHFQCTYRFLTNISFENFSSTSKHFVFFSSLYFPSSFHPFHAVNCISFMSRTCLNEWQAYWMVFTRFP